MPWVLSAAVLISQRRAISGRFAGYGKSEKPQLQRAIRAGRYFSSPCSVSSSKTALKSKFGAAGSAVVLKALSLMLTAVLRVSPYCIARQRAQRRQGCCAGYQGQSGAEPLCPANRCEVLLCLHRLPTRRDGAVLSQYIQDKPAFEFCSFTFLCIWYAFLPVALFLLLRPRFLVCSSVCFATIPVSRLMVGPKSLMCSSPPFLLCFVFYLC